MIYLRLLLVSLEFHLIIWKIGIRRHWKRSWSLKKNDYSNQNKATEIVCKHFLDAVERKQYGWFWVYPNGNKECRYRHALPLGYISKSQMKALLEEESEKISIEEEIENQRAKVVASTQITTEISNQWKKKQLEEKEGLALSRAERAKNDRMSGRELFLADASLFVDDAEAYEKYQREEPEDTEEKPKSDAAEEEPSTSTSTVDGVMVTKYFLVMTTMMNWTWTS